MGFDKSLPLRVAQGIFALAVLGLSCYVINWHDRERSIAAPSQVSFLVFVPLFSFVSLAYLEFVEKFVPEASHPYLHLALESLNALFYFAGFIALSNFLSRLLFCRGSVCSAARADAVIAAIGWLLWTASTGILFVELGAFKLRSKGDDPEKGERGGMATTRRPVVPASRVV